MGLTYDEKKLDEILEQITEIARKKKYATEEEVNKIIREVYE